MQRRTLAALTAAAMLVAGMARADAEYVGSFAWTSDAPHHGGWSAVELSADGTGLTALSDRGYWITGTLQRDALGRIDGLAEGPLLRLLGRDGAEIEQKIADSEGLAMASDGQLYVSFEAVHRVWRYPSVGGTPQPMPKAKDFAHFQENSGLEALAIAPDGTLYTLPERSGAMTRPFPVYRFKDGQWSQPFSLPRRGDYLAVGADFGPDGKLYLLERHFAGLLGFTSRVRRFTLEADKPVEEILLTTPIGRHGNLEGLAVWQDAEGAIRLTMVADNNFRAFQRSQIVEYRLPPEKLDKTAQAAYPPRLPR